jgi:hypothetical protein
MTKKAVANKAVHAMPHWAVRVVDEILMTPSDKIQKFVQREWAAALVWGQPSGNGSD